MNLLASRGQLRASLIRWSLFLVPVVILLGFISGQVGGSAADNPWFQALQKPLIYPPAIVFPIVWTALYAIMGFALALVVSARGARGRGAAIAAFVVQFALNLAWSPVFFAMHQISGALYLLLAIDIAVFVTLILFWKVRTWAGVLLLPYLAWVLFATALNWQFLQLNPAADGQEHSGAVQRLQL